MIMGFDGVSTNATSATLSVGQDRSRTSRFRRSKIASAGSAHQQPAETAAPAKPETKGNAQKPASQAKPQ
jgi:hypothetical protein